MGMADKNLEMIKTVNKLNLCTLKIARAQRLKLKQTRVELFNFYVNTTAPNHK